MPASCSDAQTRTSTAPRPKDATASSSTEHVAAGVAEVGSPDGTLARAAAALVARFGVRLEQVAPGAPIPASYWGAPEAGLRGMRLFVREDTPLHSLLHECAHYVCMHPDRRRRLDTDAGGDDLEECAVCYLSIVLAGELAGFGRERMLADMDAWGYSFRLGSARRWFREDADDARRWLAEHALLDGAGRATWRLRGE